MAAFRDGLAGALKNALPVLVVAAIAMAGDKITMARGSMMMIHDASGGCWGPASLMEDTAGILHKLSDSYADIYTARAGKERAHWREQMRAESWYTAEEAVAAGLADEWSDAVDELDETGAETRIHIDPRMRYDMAMRARAAAPVAPELPVSTESGDPNRKDEAMAYGDLQAGLRERLGVTDADASDETLLAALDEALDEQADTTTETAAAAALPEGTVAIDATVLAELQSNARLGAEARAEQQRERRDGIVAAALREGRITAQSRDDWRARLDKDEKGYAEVLASLPKNTVNVEEVGHSDTLTSSEDSLYAAMYPATEKEA